MFARVPSARLRQLSPLPGRSCGRGGARLQELQVGVPAVQAPRPQAGHPDGRRREHAAGRQDGRLHLLPGLGYGGRSAPDLLRAPNASTWATAEHPSVREGQARSVSGGAGGVAHRIVRKLGHARVAQPRQRRHGHLHVPRQPHACDQGPQYALGPEAEARPPACSTLLATGSPSRARQACCVAL